MKLTFLVISFLLLMNQIALGQPEILDADFNKMDTHSRKIPELAEKTVESIVTYLIEPTNNDYEKIRGIYSWIIMNITYDNAALKSGFYRINQSNADILKRRKAICFGYAKLMEAMCKFAEIDCEVIIGYAKGIPNTSDDLKEINHAWNAVKLEGKWFLIDATWAAGTAQLPNIFGNNEGGNYFLSEPKLFIINHLPANHIWQLLDCSITASVFKKGQFQIKEASKEGRSCINFQDSIEVFRQLSWHQQRIKTMEFAYRDNPVEKNKTELAQTYMDYEGELSAIAERLENTEHLDSLFDLQTEMIAICSKVAKMTTLYKSQVENCAYTHINQGVAISKREITKREDLELMLQYFQTAKAFLESLENSFFINDGIERCDTYIEFTLSELREF